MFGKKSCHNCGEKIDKNYNFCPYCRAPITKEAENEDWGLLGKNDFMQEEQRLPMGFNMLFNSLVKNLSKQFSEIESSAQKPEIEKKNSKKTNLKKGGISISISTSGNRPPEIKVTSFGNIPEFKQQESEIKRKIKLPESDAGKFSGLPKKEPNTNIRRLSNKVIYEINMPGVKSIKDVSIIQLENSIEIKALSKGKVFYKVIPINLPIKKYNLSKGTLVLELDSKE